MMATVATVLRRVGAFAGVDNRKIFAAALLVGSLAFAGKLAGMARELLIAARFGTGDEVDAYVLASELPAYAINVVAGAFGAALIPAFVEVRDRDGVDAARRLLSGVLIVSLALLGVASLVLGLAGPAFLGVVASGFGPEKLELTRQLLLILLPTVVLSGLATLLVGVLNADEHFALGSASALAVSACSIAGLLLSSRAWGINGLAVGLVFGFAAQLGLVAWGVARAGVWPISGWRTEATAVRGVIGQYLPMLAGMLLISSSGLVDQAMAATLGGGSAAVYSYGVRIVAVVLSVGTMALGTAVLPYFSRMVAASDWIAIRHTLRTYTGVVLVATIPLTIGLVVFSEPLTRLLYERGEFTAADTTRVGNVQALLALQIPFYSLGILYVRLITSLKANRILMYGTVISFILNVGLDYLLKELLGVPGIALATTIVYIVSLAYLATMLHRLLERRLVPCA